MKYVNYALKAKNKCKVYMSGSQVEWRHVAIQVMQEIHTVQPDNEINA